MIEIILILFFIISLYILYESFTLGLEITVPILLKENHHPN